MASITWLDKLEQELNVDVDWMDPNYIKSMLPKIRFHDQTSNQLWVDIQLGDESNAELLKQTAAELKDAGWLAIYTRMAVLMVKKNIDMISGRVLLQTLPSKAYDTEFTLSHARLHDAEFKRAGISRDRFAIKIPSTGPALNAAKILQAEGIQTLGTALFGVPQAVACSQAGCLYISPYYNDTRAHDFLDELWPNVKDPAKEHPNSPRVVQILEVYRRLYKATGKEQPLLKNASIISAEEALAASEMGCHSVTISHTVLNELASRTYDASTQPGQGIPKTALQYRDGSPAVPARLQSLLTIDPLREDGKPQFTLDKAVKIDYLAEGGKALEAAIAADPTSKKRLEVALELFTRGENRSKEKVEKALAAL
ncbi:transaldolase [Sporothrix schenckii 1099-18]|uniref:Transaldolase n=1 Tax=Sporothrix schenckii 1099-18 TaxID=1397361 RepID=A0A0F2MKC8_SPOSC|nr:transaldolase [Sporothrix schenckii 1099-18]KJR90067.1 transaldolase [Sporothrix schenckii 1099-18]